jgi:metallo-beta-lactamase class B
MKISRALLALMLVLSVTAAVTMLLAQAPAQGGGQGGGGAAAGGGGAGRGPAPVAIPTPTPEVMNEDPQTETMRNDRMNFPPFKIIGNLYYVGTAFCGSYLITTPQGNILINSNYEETVPLMKAGIESLGFKFEDTKILLASHAHADHQTGDAMVKQMTGATTEFMAEDVPAIQNIKPGGKEHPIDKVLHDGDTVTLGGMTLTAHLNPGHTLGCTTWTFPVMDAGRRYNVTTICGGLQDNARLVFNAQQPDIADVWASTIAKWKTYPTDIFLGAHTWFFNLTGKYKAMKANPRVNPWIDPDGYKKYIASVEELRAQLIKDQTAAGPPAPRGGGRGGAGGGGGAGGAGGAGGGGGQGRGPAN